MIVWLSYRIEQLSLVIRAIYQHSGLICTEKRLLNGIAKKLDVSDILVSQQNKYFFLYLIIIMHNMIFVLVLNLGHSPLYRHFCKCLYIVLLIISLVY